MSNPTISVNHYLIRQAVIRPQMMTKGINPGNNAPFDISSLIVGITISEGVGTSMLNGTLKIVDGSGLLENYPLRGEERLLLEIEDAIKNVRVWDLFIYKIDGVEVSNVNKMLTYNLHFITFQSFIALNTIITKPYKSLKISDMAMDIFEESFWRKNNDETFADVTVQSRNTNGVFNYTRKGCILEETEGISRVVIPRLNAHQAMDFLVRRSFSTTSPSSSFRFFETSSNYYFISDEELFLRALNDKQLSFPMTFDASIPKGGVEFGWEFNNLTKFTNSSRVDTLDDIQTGAYKNHVIELDLFRGTANIRPTESEYDYYTARQSYKTSEGQVADSGDRHTKEFIDTYVRSDNAKQFIIYRDWSEGSDVAAFQLRGEQYFKQITQNREPFRKNLNSLTVYAEGPGRLDITPGTIIEVNMQDINASTSDTKQNEQLAGRYLVMGIQRNLGLGLGTNTYAMVKMNWTSIENTGNIGKSVVNKIESKVNNTVNKVFDIFKNGIKL